MDGMNEFNSNTYSSASGPATSESAYTGPYGVPPAGGPQNPGYAGPPYAPPVPGTPNPRLAALLGFIPGVGAMYNGQFAKGIAQIVIFGVLTSLADHVNGIFGLLVAGWVFYMVFDAYQTARARRDGLQVPDPFGLNNIGERFGLGHGPNWNDFVARPPAPGPVGASETATNAGPVPPYAGQANTYATQEAAYGSQSGYAPAGAPYAQPAYGNNYVPPVYGAVPPPYAPYGTPAYMPPAPVVDPIMPPRTGMPTGAIWLIGLGVLALLSSLGHNYYFHGKFFAGALLVFVGVVLLIQQLNRARGLYPERSAAANWYAVNSSRGGVFLIAIGAFMLLDTASIARWHYTWPYLFILLGLYQIASRTAYNRMLAEMPSPYSAPVAGSGGVVYTTPPPAPTSTSTSIVSTHNEEGR